jgi:hypothetical protein
LRVSVGRVKSILVVVYLLFSTTSMSQTPRPRRGVPQVGPQDYAAVPQSPRSNTNQPSGSYYQARSPTRTPSGSSNQHQVQSGRGAIAMGVASGAIGAGYGPYSVRFCSMFHHSNRSSYHSISPTNPEMLVSTTIPASVQLIQINH